MCASLSVPLSGYTLLYHGGERLSIENAKKNAQNYGDVFVHNDEREGVAGLVKVGNSGNLSEL